MKHRIIIGISGVSGSIYALRLIEILLGLPKEIHIMASDMALKVFKHEQNKDLHEIIHQMEASAGVRADAIIHDNNNLFAPVASGSFQTEGMVIIPCSMKTLSAVASVYTHTLLDRAADVTLKERRPLILVTRESPLSLIHLRNMVAVTEAGATVMPACPGFYHHPKSIDDLADFMVARVLDHLKIEYPHAPRWGSND
ncbi:MAG: UbiX family flavin prenyltransferase [Deltaproteobacteria bacterium]|nr:UbiX family flavin prenyltransferase [Deltaproteobacteria bacterium]